MALEITAVKLSQWENAKSSILSTFSPMVTLSIWVHQENVKDLIVVTELPIVTVFNSVQSSNALLPIFVTELGMETSVNSVQSSYLQPIITQYFIDNKSEIWLLFLIAHSKR